MPRSKSALESLLAEGFVVEVWKNGRLFIAVISADDSPELARGEGGSLLAALKDARAVHDARLARQE